MKAITKLLVVIIIIAVVAIPFGVGISLLTFANNSKPAKSDCILVLGCQVYGTKPSPFLAARLDEGLRLYKEGYAKYIIVSGGRGNGENISEAEAMRNYLMDKGVEGSKIILEDKSTSTMSNIENSKVKMDEKGFNRCIIVSNKYHLKRAYLMAKKVGINATTSGVFVQDHKNHEISGFIREIAAIIKFYIFKR
jgi:uncharacterized SAM-binding protein YcdF (DUF218 family)